MNIIPISAYPIQSSSVPGVSTQKAQTGKPSFKNAFEDALNEINEANEIRQKDSIYLAAGDIDDLGEIANHSQKAELSFQLMVQVRNKLLDSYQELMRINV